MRDPWNEGALPLEGIDQLERRARECLRNLPAFGAHAGPCFGDQHDAAAAIRLIVEVRRLRLDLDIMKQITANLYRLQDEADLAVRMMLTVFPQAKRG
jgi:hypothetical protein